jgi:hypothetical protein
MQALQLEMEDARSKRIYPSILPVNSASDGLDS